MAAEIQRVGLEKNAFERLGAFFIRYGLVLVLGWIGAMKFTAYEAQGIKSLVETSPFMSWLLLGAALFTLGDSLASEKKRGWKANE